MVLRIIFGICFFVFLLHAEDEITQHIHNYTKAEEELLQEKKRLRTLEKELNEVADNLQKQKSFYQKELIAKLDHLIFQYQQKVGEKEKQLHILGKQLAEQEAIREQIIQEMTSPGVDSTVLSNELREQQHTTETILLKQREILQQKEALHKQLDDAQITKRQLQSNNWIAAKQYTNERFCHKKTPRGFFATGEYLYFGVWQDDLDIAGRGATYPGEIQETEFDWSSSFRVGIGYQINENWSSSLTYFYYTPEGEKTIAGGSNTMDPLFYTRISSFSAQGIQLSPVQSIVTLDNLDHVQTSVSLKMQLLEGTLSRKILSYKWLRVYGQFGLQGVYARERLNNAYTGRTRVAISELGSPLSTLFFDYTIHTQDRWRFQGGGIFLGGEGAIPLSNKLSFVTHGKGSILLGKYHNRYRYFTVQGTTGDANATQFEDLFRDFRTIDGNEDFAGMNFLLSFRTGFSWDHTFAKSSSISLHILYEAMLWMGLSRFRRGLQGRAFFIEPTPTTQYSTAAGMTSAIDPTHVAIHGLVVSGNVTF